MKLPVLFVLGGASLVAHAATPTEVLAGYRSAAGANFVPSAQRGAEFFARRFAVSDKMPACTSCHTEKPTQAGRHVVTGKAIKPLAPEANAERLTDLAKVEKWFGRNCQEVLGRACSAAEKADFVAFLIEARQR